MRRCSASAPTRRACCRSSSASALAAGAGRHRRAALCGALLALPALRVTGPYLAMVTLAFGTIVQILINE